MKKLSLIFLALIAFLPLQAATLEWDPNPVGDLVTSYKVYEHVGSAYNLIGTVPAPATTYGLVGVPPGSHVYAVSAVNIAGESLTKSNEVTLPGLPSAPKNLKVTTP